MSSFNKWQEIILGSQKEKNPRNPFFVPNSNVNSLPKGCKGVLVAFCDKMVSETKEP